MTLELRHLRYFIAVAEHGHFGRAGTALHVAQSSLSSQIRQLEDDIGTALFHRTTRRVRLTAAGETFLEESRRVLAQLEAAVERTREVASGTRGRLRVGYVSGAMHSVFPRIISAFSDAFPSVAVHLESLSTEMQIAAIRERRLDIGLFVAGVVASDLATAHGWREPLILALPRSSALSRKRTLRYADLEGQPLVVYARTSGSHMQDCILDVLRRRDIHADIVHEGNEADTVVGLVAAGRGVALVPRTWSTLAFNGVEFRPIEPVESLPGLAFYWHLDEPDPLVRAFVGSAVQTIQQEHSAN